MFIRRNQEAIKRIVDRAIEEESDLEAILVDELVRYLEGQTGLFAELGATGNVSLHEITATGALSGTREEQALRLSTLIEQAEATGQDVLDVLTAEVQANRLSMPDALAFAFQFGKRVQRLADQIENHQLREHELALVEQQAVQRELAGRSRRQRSTQGESSAAASFPTARQVGA
jgi:hypothetical protein